MTVAAENNHIHAGINYEEAKQLIDATKTTDLAPGTYWYLIDQHWWSNLQQNYDVLSKSQDQSLIDLGPLDNSQLLEKEPGTDKVRLKQSLVEELNYSLVPEHVFEAIKKKLGLKNGEADVIKRPVVQGTVLQKDAFVEVYPLQLQVAKLNAKNDIKILNVSYADSFEELKKKAFDLLQIPEDKRAEAQIKFEKNKNDYETINEKVSTNLASILRMDMVFYVDDNSVRVTRSSSRIEGMNGSLSPTKRYSGYAPCSSYSTETHTPGICGLQNLGNTCFMNSALQCLSNVPELTEYFLTDQYLNEINYENVLGTHGKLVQAYADLIKEMWSGRHSTVKPYQFKCVIGQHAPRFNGYAQQDSQELMSFLLDGLHEDLNRIVKKPYIEERESDGRPDGVVAEEAWADYKKRNDSVIVDLMHGQIKSTLVCPVCDKVSIKFDPILYLTVPVPQREKNGKSSVVVLRPKQRWAKFTIAHTNKSTFDQLSTAVKENLKIDKDTRLVIATGGLTPAAYEPEQPIPVMTSYYSACPRQFFAYLCRPGPLIIVANMIMNSFNKSLTSPLITNFDFKLTRRDIVEKVLPRIYEHFSKEHTVSTSSNAPDESKFGGAGVRLGRSEGSSDSGTSMTDSLNAPPELKDIAIEVNGDASKFPDDPDEEIELPKTISVLPKILLRWEQNDLFAPLSVAETLVDRELNIQAPQKAGNTLNDCLDMFTVREQLDENDSWYCPKCKEHRRAFKKLDLWKLPRILIVHLKRFNYSRYSREKTDTEISIPVKGFCPTSINPKQKQVKYDLIGVCNHMGGLGSGHYTAKAINKSTGRWADFNDSSAFLCGEVNDPLVSREAYWMVYRQRTEPTQPNSTHQRTHQPPQRVKRITESEAMEESD
ncbi:unnamed protein product [Bursaphelenchus xylophilus]|uniref:Ubiquitin carboxyl-terminal hydrolase n=1 Tax=Bursaphelenchus xylophilus TaxID=6326 RepID=A0A1I7RUM3_BURXY|nr:unnamed protein product [Bursaphelenchus xylophilus]CAG9114221.1 unnamed protein product [Bursaphelenchus xylophilus]